MIKVNQARVTAWNDIYLLAVDVMSEYSDNSEFRPNIKDKDREKLIRAYAEVKQLAEKKLEQYSKNAN